MSGASRVAVACALIAAATGAAAALVTLSVANWNVTVLVRMAEEQPLARFARETDPNFEFVHYHGRGDGVYYYAIARDPVLRGEEHRVIMWAPYRYGHPGFSWAAWALTLGTASFIPLAFLLLNLTGLALAAGASSKVAVLLGHSPWAGMLIALNPGLIYSVTIDTSEPLAAGLLAAALLAWISGRRKIALPLLVALCFMKEWFVLVPLGLAAWELLQIRRGAPARPKVIRTLALGGSIAPFALWYSYLIIHFREWPASPTGDFLQFPPTGWIKTARLASDFGLQTFDRVVVGHVAVPLLAAAAAAFGFGIIRALQLRHPIDTVFLMFMPVLFAMNHWGLLHAKDFIREIAIPLVLLPAAAAAYPRSTPARAGSGRLDAEVGAAGRPRPTQGQADARSPQRH